VARDYDGGPTVLFVTTEASAEDRIMTAAHLLLERRGHQPFQLLATATHAIESNALGILGPIWHVVGEAATPVQPPELLLDKLFEVIRQSGFALSCHNRRRFRNKLFGIDMVDPDRVELKQDSRHLAYLSRC
jgi:hypothetical protein